ncbi:MAG: AlpA family transcriptional regulator [Methylococcaceae bacterium]
MTPAQNLNPPAQLLRIDQVIGNAKKGIPALIPVSRSTFDNRVKAGLYPQPVKLTERLKAWRVDDINRLIESMAQQAAVTVSSYSKVF